MAALFLAACGGQASPRSEVGQVGDSGEVDGPVSAEVASGEALFDDKLCTTCHTVGDGELVGPDLVDVTARRSREWILGMILNPDSMTQYDADAAALLDEYGTPMMRMGLTAAEASAIYAYLKSAHPN